MALKPAAAGATGTSQRVEWPTLFVASVCYTGFIGGLIAYPYLGAVPAIIILAVSITLHSSLQHEALHGHPFGKKWMNELLVFPPLGLFIPYQRFRDLHLLHHYDPHLTDPYDDPESNYVDPARWVLMPWPVKMLLRFNNTLLGRMMVGPVVGLAMFYRTEGSALLRADAVIWRAYGLHFLGVGIILLAVGQWMPLSDYLIAAYLAMSILKIRTFLEHRAHETVPGRTVIIEDRGLLAFLFLNNNLHSVHHAHPKVSWYRLPAVYADRREEFLRRNRSFLYKSYWTVFAQYLLKSKDPVPHPLLPQPVIVEVAGALAESRT